MSAPYEIVAGPLTLFAAPVGTAFPTLVTTAPSGSWKKIGASGTKSYEEEGVKVNVDQSFEGFRPAGGTHKRKTWRTEEDLKFTATVVDYSPEQLALTHDNASITTVAAGAGTPGTKTIKIGRGIEVVQFALIAEGLSPVGDGMVARWQVPACYQAASQELQFAKKGPVGLAIEFEVLEAVVGDFAELVVQTAPAS